MTDLATLRRERASKPDILVIDSTDVLIAAMAHMHGKYGQADLSDDYEGHRREVYATFYASGKAFKIVDAAVKKFKRGNS